MSLEIWAVTVEHFGIVIFLIFLMALSKIFILFDIFKHLITQYGKVAWILRPAIHSSSMTELVGLRKRTWWLRSMDIELLAVEMKRI